MRYFLGMCAGFYYLRLSVNLTQNCGGSGDLEHSKSIFQRNRKTFSFLNYVNIRSFQSYFLITFILFLFLFLGLWHNGHKIFMKPFAWFVFTMSFLLNTSYWLQSLSVLLIGDIKINPGPNRTPKAINIPLWHSNLNSISAHNYLNCLS